MYEKIVIEHNLIKKCSVNGNLHNIEFLISGQLITLIWQDFLRHRDFIPGEILGPKTGSFLGMVLDWKMLLSPPV